MKLSKHLKAKGPDSWGRRTLLFCISLAYSVGLFSQEEPKKWEIGGYVKYLHQINFAEGSIYPLTSNFIHHRLNIRYYPTEHWKLVASMRNRLFWGEFVKYDSLFNFTQQIDQPMGLVDLSVNWFNDKNGFLHSIFDRAYVQYSKNKWDNSLGRQRIIWGINLVWNPTDLFNAFNFLDFDYEERPGNDALRVQYYPGLLSTAEVSIAPDDTLKNSIAAARYRFNTSGYDIQLQVGYYRGDLALGAGWDGAIGGAGFNGEGTYFIPLEASDDSVHSLNLAISGSYVFGSGIFTSLGVLYNSNGNRGTGVANQFGFLSSQPSPKNLYPSEWAFFGQVSGNFTPLFTGSLAILYATQLHLTILVPTLSYSIKENWSIDLIVQSALVDASQLPVLPTREGFQNLFTGASFRLKWSY